MVRRKAQQHVRRLKSGKTVLVNRGIHYAERSSGKEYTDLQDSHEVKELLKTLPDYTNLSTSEKEQVEEYFLDSGPVNEALREGKMFNENLVKNVDTAISKNTLPFSASLYRDISKRVADREFNRLDVGDTYTDNGFCSSSLDKHYIRQTFGMRKDRKGDQEIYEINIKMKQGAPALIMPKVGIVGAPQVKKESEILLPRGTTFKVVGRSIVSASYRGVSVTVNQLICEVV